MQPHAPAEPPPDADAAARAAHHALVASLAAPSAWPVPLPPGAGFEVVETHISTLILAGDHVLKLKKPLRLPFLDFSTQERRRHFCAEECRLNRRTAPALYLGLRPVHGPVAAPRVGALQAAIEEGDRPVGAAAGSGPDGVIEWGVWMRRFDQADLFDVLARSGRLGADDIDALGDEIARFHAAQQPCLPAAAHTARPAASASAAPLGSPALLQQAVAQTLVELQAPALAGQLPPALVSRLAVLARWSAGRAVALAPLLHTRHAAGAVIEGHGDLHLGNIVRLDGRPCLFDALEFDPGLRLTDRMADLAFPFMDLQDHGLPRLAWRLLGRVLDNGGDWGGLPLLRWLAAYRALVRAKVALLGAAQGTAVAAQRAAAMRRIALADRLAHPGPAPLILVCGLSGSGKSTVAAMLAERLGAVRVRSDVERKRLHGLAPTARVDDPALLYGADSTRRTYACLLDVARAAQAGAVGLVLDAGYLRRADRDAVRALATTWAAPFALIECHAAPATLAARISRRQARAQDASDADLAVLARQQVTHEAPAPEEGAHRLDTEGDLATVAQRLDAWLAATPFASGDAPAARAP